VLLSLWTLLGQDVRMGKISGSVEDPTSSLIAGASVTLLSLNRVHKISSNSDGTFRFEGLEPGIYAIEITMPGFAKKIIPVTLRLTHLLETISVVLNVGNMPDMEKCGRDGSIRYEDVDATKAALAGTLRDYFGRKPIARAEIAIVSESGKTAPVVLQSDATGQFAVSHLAPDYYDIRIACKGYNREEFKHVAMPRDNRVLLESTLRKSKQIVVCQ
jgi:hypothetical protein